jgi:RNA polymerase sigma-70 factor (ECF subfamily)
MTDEEIAIKLQKKDLNVFDDIMKNYNKLLWLVVGNILEKAGTAEDVEDCISDVYLKLLENPKIYDYKKGTLKSFLVKLGKNMAIDKYRKLTRSNFIELNEQIASIEEDALQSIITKENKSRILNALNSLKEPDKEIIIRRYFFDEKPKLISEKMSLNIKDIENKLYQGKIKLKRILEY